MLFVINSLVVAIINFIFFFIILVGPRKQKLRNMVERCVKKYIRVNKG